MDLLTATSASPTTNEKVTGLAFTIRQPAYKRLNDVELVARCQRGDSAAMEALVVRFKRPVYSLAYRLTNNYDDASDVAATALLRICENIDKCRTVTTLSAWINRIVCNSFYDLCRKKRRTSTISLEGMTEHSDITSLPFLTSSEKSPAKLLTLKEQTALLREAITKLSETHADLLCQFYLEERSYEEIAESQDVPLGTIKSRLNRARTALLKKLRPHHTAFLP